MAEQTKISTEDTSRRAARVKLLTAVAGLALASTGVWMMHPPLALVFAGVMLIASTVGSKQ